jgi:hypothetical protein
VLPLNYQYPLSAWIYRVIGRGEISKKLFSKNENNNQK